MSLLNLKELDTKYSLKVTGIAHFGAHLGEEVKYYRELNYTNIHLFEPQKQLFKKLCESFSEDNEINLYNVGLGNQKAIKKLNLSPNNKGESASLLKPSGHLKYHPEILFEDTEDIAIEMYDEFNLVDVNYLNIDIQGYELEALKGSENGLKNYVDYIYIEISREEMYEESVLKNELDSYLKDFGFLRVTTKWASSKIPWGDSFYIKSKDVTFYKKIFVEINKFCEKFTIFYLFIDPYRDLRKWIYQKKLSIKKYIQKF